MTHDLVSNVIYQKQTSCYKIRTKLYKISSLITSVLSSVSISFEMKPELEHIVLKLAPKSMFMSEFPFSIYNFECNILQEEKIKITPIW